MMSLAPESAINKNVHIKVHSHLLKTEKGLSLGRGISTQPNDWGDFNPAQWLGRIWFLNSENSCARTRSAFSWGKLFNSFRRACLWWMARSPSCTGRCTDSKMFGVSWMIRPWRRPFISRVSTTDRSYSLLRTMSSHIYLQDLPSTLSFRWGVVPETIERLDKRCKRVLDFDDSLKWRKLGNICTHLEEVETSS